MPSDYEIDLDKQILLGRVWGVWTMQDVNEFRERAASDPDFSAQMAQLVDLADVTDIDLAVRDMVALGSSTPLGSQARRAYVAPSSAVFGMIRAYQATADEAGTHTRVFRSMKEARAWLGLD
jgi:hypothetical protein